MLQGNLAHYHRAYAFIHRLRGERYHLVSRSAFSGRAVAYYGSDGELIGNGLGLGSLVMQVTAVAASLCENQLMLIRESKETIKAKDRIVNPEGGINLDVAERHQIDRRRHNRFPFTASVIVVEHKFGTSLTGQTSDISLEGCYVHCFCPFPTGTVIKIRLTKDEETFEAEARVVSSKMGMGMGVAFTAAVPTRFRIFRRWLDNLMGKGSPEHAKSEPCTTNPDQKDESFVTDSVLIDLVTLLMAKGVLGEIESKNVLQSLSRTGDPG